MGEIIIPKYRRKSAKVDTDNHNMKNGLKMKARILIKRI
jgi:hypothetical protein